MDTSASLWEFKGGLQDYVIVFFVSSEWPECPHAFWQQWSYRRGTTASFQWGKDRHAEQGQTQYQPITITLCITGSTSVHYCMVKGSHYNCGNGILVTAAKVFK